MYTSIVLVALAGSTISAAVPESLEFKSDYVTARKEGSRERKPLAVFIVYQTAFPDNEGIVQFRRDGYQRDNDIAQKLTRAPQPPLAARVAPNQRGG